MDHKSDLNVANWRCDRQHGSSFEDKIDKGVPVANICVKRPHNLNPEQLRELGDKLAEKLTQKLGGQCRWQGDELHYSQSGATALVQFDDTAVTVNVKLGMLMAAFSGMVESEINRVLDKYL